MKKVRKIDDVRWIEQIASLRCKLRRDCSNTVRGMAIHIYCMKDVRWTTVLSPFRRNNIDVLQSSNGSSAISTACRRRNILISILSFIIYIIIRGLIINEKIFMQNLNHFVFHFCTLRIIRKRNYSFRKRNAIKLYLNINKSIKCLILIISYFENIFLKTWKMMTEV